MTHCSQLPFLSIELFTFCPVGVHALVVFYLGAWSCLLPDKRDAWAQCGKIRLALSPQVR